MPAFVVFVSLLLPVFPSLAIGRSIENRLERLEQTVQALQTVSVEKDDRILELEKQLQMVMVERDNRITELKSQLSAVNERVNSLELLRDKDAEELERVTATDELDSSMKTHEKDSALDSDTNTTKQDSNGEEVFGKNQKQMLDEKKQRNYDIQPCYTPFRSSRESVSSSPKIAFHAYQSSSRSYGTHETMLFDRETLDVGNGYNNADGIYDVPVTGVYVFVWTIVSYAHNFHEAELVVNGIVKGSAYGDAEGLGDHQQATGLIAVQVNQGDHVSVRVGYNTGGLILSDENHGRTTFTGWLLFST